MAAASFDAFQRGQVSAFVSGTGIGTLAGLIGLGGAEFRLPFLISMFRFGALEAVIINKAMSLVVVASALPFRTGTTSIADITGQWPVIVNLLAGADARRVARPLDSRSVLRRWRLAPVRFGPAPMAAAGGNHDPITPTAQLAPA